MDQSYAKKNIIFSCVAFIWLYAVSFSMPLFQQAKETGFSLNHQNVITYVQGESPADLAGLKIKDQVIFIAGKSMEEWRKLYRQNCGLYLETFAPALQNQSMITVVRDQRIIRFNLRTESASKGFGILSLVFRIFFALFISGLACFIVWSNPSDHIGFLAAQGLTLATLTTLSGTRYTRLFLGPYVGVMSESNFIVVSIVSIAALILLLCALVRFSRAFPNGGKERHLAFIYGFPVLGILVLLFSFQGSLAQKLTQLHGFGISLTALYLCAGCFFVVRNYLRSKSPLEKVRIRAIGFSILFVSLTGLLLWVIPKWVFHHSIVPNIDWMYVPALFAPLAILFSIDKHHIFGIPGIARRRLRNLEKQLKLEQYQTAKKDERIQKLNIEIQQLRQELATQQMAHLPAPPSPDLHALEALEAKYSYIKHVRKDRLIGADPCWVHIFEQVIMAARFPSSVLILGESGTGKTDIARAIHELSGLGKYKEVSCAQFEHADPAFPLGKFFGIGKSHGIVNIPTEGRPGLLEECDGGTLFLDDVDRLPLHVQDLLLYPLENKPFEPGIGVGGPYEAKIKFIFATNQSPKKMIEDGRFRNDIFSRIEQIIVIPPLRERPYDTPLLIKHFQNVFNEHLEQKITEIDSYALQNLVTYPYDEGNIRELKRELQTAMAKALFNEETTLKLEHLSPSIQTQMPQTKVEETPTAPLKSLYPEAGVSQELDCLRRNQFNIKQSEIELGLSNKSRTLSNHLRGICYEALKDCHWNIELASKQVAGPIRSNQEKVKKRMNRLLLKVRTNINEEKEKLLFNNLTLKYHEALEATIDWVKTQPLT